MKAEAVELCSEVIIDDYATRDMDKAELDRQIRVELALDFARKLIDEDLVDIRTNHDIETMHTTVSARLKVIQE